MTCWVTERLVERLLPANAVLRCARWLKVTRSAHHQSLISEAPSSCLHSRPAGRRPHAFTTAFIFIARTGAEPGDDPSTSGHHQASHKSRMALACFATFVLAHGCCPAEAIPRSAAAKASVHHCLAKETAHKAAQRPALRDVLTAARLQEGGIHIEGRQGGVSGDSCSARRSSRPGAAADTPSRRGHLLPGKPQQRCGGGGQILPANRCWRDACSTTVINQR